MTSPTPIATGVASETATFRRFTRMYTRFIGTLSEGIYDSEFSLAEARVLYELATRVKPLSSDIGAALGVDPGYLSRILRKFEQSGLLHKKASDQDGRSIELKLSARGRAAFKRLDALSETQAQATLDKLAMEDRNELIRSMRAIDDILSNAARSKQRIVLRPHRTGDMGWVVFSEARGYAEQFSWDNTFEALVASIVSEFVTHFDPSRERCWIAEVDGRNVGHIFLVKHPDDPTTAKLRLLFVEAGARGMGVGDALVTECLRFARTAGYGKVVLWTQSILTAAHKIYQRAGFRMAKEEPHHSFGHDLIGQEWELELK